MEAPREEDLPYPETHQVVVNVPFAPLLIVCRHEFVEVHGFILAQMKMERKRGSFLDLGLTPVYYRCYSLKEHISQPG